MLLKQQQVLVLDIKLLKDSMLMLTIEWQKNCMLQLIQLNLITQ